MGHLLPFLGRLAVSLTLVSGILWSAVPAPAQAQYTPPNRGLPGRREGGGTRGNNCTASDRPLTALAPEFSVDNIVSVYGTTVSDTPKLYWYVPEVNAEVLEFVLLDETENEVFVQELPVNAASGMIEIEIPLDEGGNGSRLAANEDYHWFFSIVCDQGDRSGDIISEGWIRRIPLADSLDDQLKTAPPLEQSDVFVDAGIWYDAVSTTAQQLCQQPDNTTLSNQWNELLTSVALESLASEPLLLDCSEN